MKESVNKTLFFVSLLLSRAIVTENPVNVHPYSTLLNFFLALGTILANMRSHGSSLRALDNQLRCEECYATYAVLSGAGLGGVLLDSPHFIQLCSQSSRYFSSLVRTASAALQHKSLCSLQPASPHSLAINAQCSRASSALNATRLVRTSRQSSLANMHVLTCLN